jgi:hypothetical protein
MKVRSHPTLIGPAAGRARFVDAYRVVVEVTRSTHEPPPKSLRALPRWIEGCSLRTWWSAPFGLKTRAAAGRHRRHGRNLSGSQ